MFNTRIPQSVESGPKTAKAMQMLGEMLPHQSALILMTMASFNTDQGKRGFHLIDMAFQVNTVVYGSIDWYELTAFLATANLELEQAFAYIVLAVTDERVSYNPTRKTFSYNRHKIDNEAVQKMLVHIQKERPEYGKGAYEVGYVRKDKVHQFSPEMQELSSLVDEMIEVTLGWLSHAYTNDLDKYYNS
jgi:hypothetical protein